MQTKNYDNYEKMSQAAADIVLEAIKKNPRLVLGLPTGSTPIGMYDALAKAFKDGKADFSCVKTFNLDEYVGLAPEHPQSYRYFMDKYLFGRVNLQPQNIHIPNGAANEIEKEAAAYDEMIENNGGIDLFIVGIGQNGHIGFNEPASAMPAFTHVVELTESTIRANARLFNNISEVPKKAVTQGMATIMRAKQIVLLSSGETKRDALTKMKSGIITLDCPATLLNLHNNVLVLEC